jgi:hypothetical protein
LKDATAHLESQRTKRAIASKPRSAPEKGTHCNGLSRITVWSKISNLVEVSRIPCYKYKDENKINFKILYEIIYEIMYETTADSPFSAIGYKGSPVISTTKGLVPNFLRLFLLFYFNYCTESQLIYESKNLSPFGTLMAVCCISIFRCVLASL